VKGGGAEAAELRPRPAGSFRTERGRFGRARRAPVVASSCRRGLAARGGHGRRPAARSPTAPGILVCGVRKRQRRRARRAPLRALACLDWRAAIFWRPSLECCAIEAVRALEACELQERRQVPGAGFIACSACAPCEVGVGVDMQDAGSRTCRGTSDVVSLAGHACSALGRFLWSWQGQK